MRLRAIIAVSAIEKKPEINSSTTRAAIWAQSGRCSTAPLSLDRSAKAGGRKLVG